MNQDRVQLEEFRHDIINELDIDDQILRQKAEQNNKQDINRIILPSSQNVSSTFYKDSSQDIKADKNKNIPYDDASHQEIVQINKSQYQELSSLDSSNKVSILSTNEQEAVIHLQVPNQALGNDFTFKDQQPPLEKLESLPNSKNSDYKAESQNTTSNQDKSQQQSIQSGNCDYSSIQAENKGNSTIKEFSSYKNGYLGNSLIGSLRICEPRSEIQQLNMDNELPIQQQCQNIQQDQTQDGKIGKNENLEYQIESMKNIAKQEIDAEKVQQNYSIQTTNSATKENQVKIQQCDNQEEVDLKERIGRNLTILALIIATSKKASEYHQQFIFPKTEFQKLKLQDNFVCFSCKGTCPCNDCSQTSLFNDVRILQLGIQEGSNKQTKIEQPQNEEQISQTKPSKIVLQLKELLSPNSSNRGVQKSQQYSKKNSQNKISDDHSSHDDTTHQTSKQNAQKQDQEPIQKSQSKKGDKAQTKNIQIPNNIQNQSINQQSESLKVSIFGGMKIDELDQIVKKNIKGAQSQKTTQSVSQTPISKIKNNSSAKQKEDGVPQNSKILINQDCENQQNGQPSATINGSKIQVRLFDSKISIINEDHTQQDMLQLQTNNSKSNEKLQSSTTLIQIPTKTNYTHSTCNDLDKESNQTPQSRESKSTLITITQLGRAQKRMASEQIDENLQPLSKRQKQQENDNNSLDLKLNRDNFSQVRPQQESLQDNSQQENDDMINQKQMDCDYDDQTLNYDEIKQILLKQDNNNQQVQLDPIHDINIQELYYKHIKDKLQQQNNIPHLAIPQASKGFLPVSPNSNKAQGSTISPQFINNLNSSNLFLTNHSLINSVQPYTLIPKSVTPQVNIFGQGGQLTQLRQEGASNIENLSRERLYSNQLSIPKQQFIQQQQIPTQIQNPQQQIITTLGSSNAQIIPATIIPNNTIQNPQNFVSQGQYQQPQYVLDPNTMQLIDINRLVIPQQQGQVIQQQIILPQQQQVAYIMPNQQIVTNPVQQSVIIPQQQQIQTQLISQPIQQPLIIQQSPVPTIAGQATILQSTQQPIVQIQPTPGTQYVLPQQMQQSYQVLQTVDPTILNNGNIVYHQNPSLTTQLVQSYPQQQHQGTQQVIIQPTVNNSQQIQFIQQPQQLQQQTAIYYQQPQIQ